MHGVPPDRHATGTATITETNRRKFAAVDPAADTSFGNLQPLRNLADGQQLLLMHNFGHRGRLSARGRAPAIW